MERREGRMLSPSGASKSKPPPRTLIEGVGQAADATELAQRDVDWDAREESLGFTDDDDDALDDDDDELGDERQALL